MGVGFAVDLVVCSALGVDMYDCVFPTRTARFGSALIGKHPGSVNLKVKQRRMEFEPLEEGCDCSTCKNYTRYYIFIFSSIQKTHFCRPTFFLFQFFHRAYIHTIVKETAGCHLITVHNVAFQLRLMKNIREAIFADTFPDFIRSFMLDNFPDKLYPEWVVNSLKAVNVELIS